MILVGGMLNPLVIFSTFYIRNLIAINFTPRFYLAYILSFLRAFYPFVNLELNL